MSFTGAITNGIDKGRVACVLHWYVLSAGPGKVSSFQLSCTFSLGLDNGREGWLRSHGSSPRSALNGPPISLPARGDDDDGLATWQYTADAGITSARRYSEEWLWCRSFYEQWHCGFSVPLFMHVILVFL